MFELEAIKEQLAALQSQIACILSGECCSGGEVPNDAWVNLTETDMTLVTFASANINSLTSLDLAYKILSSDTVVIKGYLRLEITVTALTDTINLNFRWPAFTGSNWFTGSKTLQGILERVPISIINATGGLGVNSPSQQGNAIGSTLSSINLISIGQTNLQLPNGDYTIDVYFEFTSPLQAV
jgi:hypothetical protein